MMIHEEFFEVLRNNIPGQKKARKIIPTWINYPRNWHIPSQKRCWRWILPFQRWDLDSLTNHQIHGGYILSWTWPFGTKIHPTNRGFKMAPASNFPQPLSKMEVGMFTPSSKPPFFWFHDGNFPEGIFWENVIMFQGSWYLVQNNFMSTMNPKLQGPENIRTSIRSSC